MKDEMLCQVDINYRWVGPDYRRRERVEPPIPCGHLAGAHEHGICYACDSEGRVAGMHHEFKAG